MAYTYDIISLIWASSPVLRENDELSNGVKLWVRNITPFEDPFPGPFCKLAFNEYMVNSFRILVT